MINQLLTKALEFKDVNRNLNVALKYAMNAATMSYSPRADVCCIIGEIYLEMGNLEWSEMWYSKAYGNMSTAIDEKLPDKDYYTLIPLLKLGYIAHMKGDDGKALEYFEAVLKIDPENETAKSNIATIRKDNKMPDEAEKTE